MALWVEAFPARPRMLFQGEVAGTYSIMRMPDGSFAFYNRKDPQAGPLSLPDMHGVEYTLLPHLPDQIAKSETIAQSRVLANQQVILIPDHQVKSVYVKSEKIVKDTAKKAGLRIYLNVWLSQAGLTDVREPKMIWHGYNGSQMEYQQLANGRLIVPFGSMLPHAKAVPPTGRHETVILYSDDNGQSWNESPSRLISPCYEGYNGSSEGSCEPAIEPLKDGRIWMLMRTAAGFLYESYSADNGTTWSNAMASRFNTSTGPPNILRHKNGWLVVTWNNCELPPRHEGLGVYGGRDALHIAVSDDEGITWRGFREIYLDHRRNDNPAQSGDRGTAYPLGAYTAEGQIVILAGQGKGGRNPIIVDPDWIVETEARTDFSDGLKQWIVYKHYGPAKRWWRARAVGCELVENPTDSSAKSLHIRKADDLAADGAVWNFPNGWKGSLTARLMIRKGYRGGIICLNDRMFDPSNDWGEQFSVFKAYIDAAGKIGNITLKSETWYDIEFKWNLTDKSCLIFVDSHKAGSLKIRHETLNGINYVRFRSAACQLDKAGFLVDSVKVSLNDPFAPACTAKDQIEHEKRYVEKLVPLWTQSPPYKQVALDDDSSFEVADGFEVVRPMVKSETSDPSPLPGAFSSGQSIVLQDGRLLLVYPNAGKQSVTFSTDEGRTWTSPQIIAETSSRPAVVQTRDGTIWAMYYIWVCHDGTKEGSTSNLYATCSRDGGRTWNEQQVIWQGYTGMTQGAIETQSGTIMMPFCYVEEPTRYLGACVYSRDGGQSWLCSDGIDIGEQTDAERRKKGPDGGTLEPSIVQLKDGRLFMVIRTIMDKLWHCYSEDDGDTWSKPEPMELTCGGPVYLTRLSTSGRLAMVWNQADWDNPDAIRWGFPYGYDRASVAVSEDEGQTWYEPVVFARNKRSVHSLVVDSGQGDLLFTMPGKAMFLRCKEQRLLQSTKMFPRLKDRKNK